MKGGGHVAQIYGESQELGTWVEGGSYPWVSLKLMYLFCVCVSFSQQSASPSPKPWWPITRNVSEGGSFPSGVGGGGGRSRSSSGTLAFSHKEQEDTSWRI